MRALTKDELEQIGIDFDIEVICNIAENRAIRKIAIDTYKELYDKGSEIALDKAIKVANELNNANER